MKLAPIRLAVPLLATCAVAAPLAPGGVRPAQERSTNVVRPPNGSPAANGGSENATFSQDNRTARLMAFDSAAGNS